MRSFTSKCWQLKYCPGLQFTHNCQVVIQDYFKLLTKEIKRLINTFDKWNNISHTNTKQSGMLFNVVHIYVQGYETPGIRFNKNIDWVLTWQCQRWLLCLVATILQHNYDYLHREQLYQYLQVSPSFVHFLLYRSTDMQFIILNTTMRPSNKEQVCFQIKSIIWLV